MVVMRRRRDASIVANTREHRSMVCGDIPRIPLNLVLLKGIRLMGFENRTILDHLPDVAAAHRAEVLDLFLNGELRPHVGAVYPLSEIGLALRKLAERRAVGKVVVSISEPQVQADEAP